MTWYRTPEQIAKDQEAATMRSRAMTYQSIGDHFGVTRQAAFAMVQRAIADIPKEGAEEVVRLEIEKLDFLERKLYEIMTKEHVAFGASGKVVTLDGVPVEDDSPVMKAIDGLLKVADRRAKLLGLNAPTKHEVITLDSVQAEIRRLEAQLGEIDELDAIEAEAGGTQGS
jgi:hypothetical protein